MAKQRATPVRVSDEEIVAALEAHWGIVTRAAKDLGYANSAALYNRISRTPALQELRAEILGRRLPIVVDRLFELSLQSKDLSVARRACMDWLRAYDKSRWGDRTDVAASDRDQSAVADRLLALFEERIPSEGSNNGAGRSVPDGSDLH